MIKIKAESLRNDKYVIHPRKEAKHYETQYKHINGEKIWNETRANPAVNSENTINIADDDLSF